MARLSVNINKVALIRNSREIELPNLVAFAKDCERYGAQGITVHPRPDERHIRYSDIPELKAAIATELNIEGNPTEEFLALVHTHTPHQVTLVPDEPGQLTSDHGWDTLKYEAELREVISSIKKLGARVSIFVDPVEELIEGAKACGTDCIELYTEPYASSFEQDADQAVKPYITAAYKALNLGLGINAGHDLNLKNLSFLNKQLPALDEVSIGHALISDALYLGIENTIQLYLRQLK